MARRVCSEERVWIEVLSGEGLSDAQIAKRLGRDRATVWREEKRCGAGAYCAVGAQADADAGAKRPRAPKLGADAELRREVQQRLDERLSPHAISAELAELGLFVCAETIYRACYDHAARGGLRAGTWNKLPRSRRRRKPRSRCEQAKRSPLGDYRPIAERPAPVEGRKEPGHWEGDLIIGKANRSAVATLVERSSRHTLVVGLAGPPRCSKPSPGTLIMVGPCRRGGSDPTWDRPLWCLALDLSARFRRRGAHRPVGRM